VTASNVDGAQQATHTIAVLTAEELINELTITCPRIVVYINNPVTLSASVAAGTSVVYTWNFGDSGTGNGQTVLHTYTTASVFSATVTASNNLGTSSASCSVAVKHGIRLPRLGR
jgi:hypothetical protein